MESPKGLTIKDSLVIKKNKGYPHFLDNLARTQSKRSFEDKEQNDQMIFFFG